MQNEWVILSVNADYNVVRCVLTGQYKRDYTKTLGVGK